DGLEGKAGLRNQAGFEPVRRADERYLVAAIAQLTRHRDSRNHMSARAAARHHESTLLHVKSAKQDPTTQRRRERRESAEKTKHSSFDLVRLTLIPMF